MRIQTGFVVGILVLTGLHLGKQVAGLAFAPVMTAALALGVIVAALLVTSSTSARVLSLGFLVLGTILVAKDNLDALSSIVPSLADNSGLVAVIIYVPLVATVFDARPFGASLITLVGRATTSEVILTSALVALTALVGVMTSVAAIVIVYGLLSSQARDEQRWERLLSTATLRGYGNGVLWAPTGVTAAIALEYSGANLISFLPAAILLALVALLIHLIFSEMQVAQPVWKPEPGLVPAKDAAQNSILFFLILLLFVATIISVNRVAELTIVDTVALCCPGFALAFFIVTRRTNAFIEHGRRYVASGVPRRAADTAIILSAGYFVACLAEAGVTMRIAQGFRDFSHHSLYLELPMLSLGVTMLCLFGLSPILSLLLVTSAIDPALIAAPAELVALALTLGTAVALMLSPFSSPVFLLSSVAGRNTIELGVRQNWGYGLALYAVGQIFLFLWLFK